MYNKTIFKNILLEFENSQKSYKKAIKYYDKYIKSYTGEPLSMVPTELITTVKKCVYSKSILQKKSNEVRLILRWLNGLKTNNIYLIPSEYNSVIKTILKIQKELL